MSAILLFLQAHLEAIIVGGVDAILLLIPSLKSNNIVQMFGNVASSLGSAIGSAVSPAAPAAPAAPAPSAPAA